MASNIPSPPAVAGPGPPVQAPSPSPALTGPSPNAASSAQPPPMASYASPPPTRGDASAQPPSMASYHVGPPSNVGNLTYQPPIIPYNPYPPTGPGVAMHPPPAPRPSHRFIPSAGMALAQQRRRQQQQQNRQQQAMTTYHQPPQPGRSSATPVPSMAVNHQLPSIHQRADPAPRMRATNSPFNLPPAMAQTTPVHSQQQPQQYQPPAHHHSPSPAGPHPTPPTHQQPTQQPQQQRQQQHHHHPPTAVPTLPQPPLIEPHPLSPSLADLKLISHPIPPTLLPHLSLTTSSSLARLFLDFEYRDLSATDYAIAGIHPAQRAWLAAHLRALNAARRESGARLVAHWQRLVRERVGGGEGEGVPGGREEELMRLDWVAREAYGRCADGTRLPVLVWEYVQLRQVRGPSAKEWEDFVVDAVGEVWRMKERRERAKRGVENGEGEGEEEGRDAGEVSTVRVGGGVVGEAELKAAMKERHRRQRSVEVVDVPPAGVSKMRSPPRTAGRQRSSTVVKPKPVKFAQSKTPKKRGGKKGSKGPVMFQAPLAGSSGSAINPIAVDSDLPDYPDDYGTGNMVAVTDKYSIAAYSSSGPDRTFTAQNTAGQILNYPETPDTKPTEQFLGSQNATATSTTPAPAPQLSDYPPIFSTDPESTHTATQQNIAAPNTLNTNNSPHIPANATPNFPEYYINSSDGHQPTITPDKHSAESPNTPQNTATHMPIPPPSAAANTPRGGTGSTTLQPSHPPSADNTHPGAAPALSKLPPAASPADPSAPPLTQANSQDLAVSQLDGAFDVSDEVLDALFNGVLEGP